MAVTIVADDDPDAALRALEGRGPVAVVDHRRRVPADLPQRLAHAPASTWLVTFTSGSTAAPRGVCRTVESWQASVEALARATATGSGTPVLVAGPLSSSLFLHAAWHARQVGARVVTEPLLTSSPWDVTHVVPAQLRLLLDSDRDLAGRTAVVAGAALPRMLAERAAGAELRLVSYYGAAELSFVAMDAGAGMLPFTAAAVAERDGVLWVRSPYVATGYLPDASGRYPAGGALRRDAAGWASVGDRGSVLPNGSVVVHGRGENAVQTGGATVHVTDVESVLRQAPEVSDVVVVGLPHPGLGQVVAAVVESRTATVQHLRRWSRPRLAAAAQPRRWLVVDALPRVSGGKVDRRATTRLLTDERASD